jgi:glycine/D-amino acid oxidase-like deaminating enzyme
VLARAAIDAQASLFAMARGRLVIGPVVREIDLTSDGVALHAEDGRIFEADVAVLAPGPGIGALLPQLGIDLAMRPVLEQVCHVGAGSATDDLPCLYDGPLGAEPGMYGMPTPGRGYKLGVDQALRRWTENDLDRVPDAAVSATISDRAARNFVDLDPAVLDAQVCSWTDSPDGRFVIDTVADGRVVLACGDSGEGFKFSALMGPLLADLAERRPADDDVATLSLARFADGSGATAAPRVLGR